MMYRAIWLDGFDEIACDDFDHLMHAQEFVLAHFASYQNQFGIDRVLVCNGKATYFSLERARKSPPAEHASNIPSTREEFNPGMHIMLVANHGLETSARIVWSDGDRAQSEDEEFILPVESSDYHLLAFHDQHTGFSPDASEGHIGHIDFFDSNAAKHFVRQRDISDRQYKLPRYYG